MRFLPVLVLLLAASAHAQPSLLDAPVREPFDGFAGAGFAPEPAAGQLDSDTWIVTGLAAGDLTFGATGTSGSYARGSSAAPVTEGGLWAFEVAASDPALGVQPTMADLTPGALETRFVNGTGGALASFTLQYECWQLNDEARATDVSVEITVEGVTESPAELDCTGAVAADGAPVWESATLETVYTPASPIPADATVGIRFVLSHRGGGADYDEVAIDDLVFGLPGSCGNGLVEAADTCDDGDPCTTDSCAEPTGCVFEPIAMCDIDGGVTGDGGTSEPSDASVPARYDANMRPNEPVPDLGASTGPEPDGCDCRVDGAPGAAAWPLALALFWVRRRR